jgi:hypothetical protein
VVNMGPLVPVSDEAIIFVLFLFYTIRWRRKGAAPITAERQGGK